MFRCVPLCPHARQRGTRARDRHAQRDTVCTGSPEIDGRILDKSEVCKSVKRDLFIWQKRPIHMAKEVY